MTYCFASVLWTLQSSLLV